MTIIKFRNIKRFIFLCSILFFFNLNCLLPIPSESPDEILSKIHHICFIIFTLMNIFFKLLHSYRKKILELIKMFNINRKNESSLKREKSVFLNIKQAKFLKFALYFINIFLILLIFYNFRQTYETYKKINDKYYLAQRILCIEIIIFIINFFFICLTFSKNERLFYLSFLCAFFSMSFMMNDLFHITIFSYLNKKKSVIFFEYIMPIFVSFVSIMTMIFCLNLKRKTFHKEKTLEISLIEKENLNDYEEDKT